MIYVIKHDMDPNSNVNYRRKIGPVGKLGFEKNQNSKIHVMFIINIT